VPRIVLLLFASLLAVAPTRAQTSGASPQRAFTTAIVRLRESPSTDASVLLAIPSRALVEVGDCGDGWCAAQYRGTNGYVAEAYLAFAQPLRIAAPSGRGYTNSRGEWVQSPTVTRDGRPPAGATAQCRDGTYSFSRSRRGTCSHHGGVSRWL
jgi:uncharacterized protein YraI